MVGIETPIFVRLGNRGRGQNPPVPGSVENVSFNNIVARGASMTSSVTGIPGYKARRVAFSNITITMEGGNQDPKGLDVPEQIDKYPESRMFGTLPGFGFYGRHVEGLALSNVHLRWDKEDLRPAMVFDDVNDLTIDGFRTDTVAGAAPVVWMNNVADALLRGSRTAAARSFLRVSGADSRAIAVVGNELTRVERRVEITNAPQYAVQETGNAVPSLTLRVGPSPAPGSRSRTSSVTRTGKRPPTPKARVQVEAASTAVETSSATIKSVVDGKRVLELPLNGSQNLLKDSPLPGADGYTRWSAATQENPKEYILRMDWRPNAKHNLLGRYLQNSDPSV